jgi:hypothetical protein
MDLELISKIPDLSKSCTAATDEWLLSVIFTGTSDTAELAVNKTELSYSIGN